MYENNVIVVWQGMITRFANLRGMVEMGEISSADILPANLDQINRYNDVQRRD